jgi:hypothetical protein
MRTTLFAALAILTLLPAASAQDIVDVSIHPLCGNDPCVEPIAEAGEDGVTVGYRHHFGLGGGAVLHAGPDGVSYDRGEGITRCHTSVGTDGTIENWCVY